MSLSTQQGALQASFLNSALQVEQQQECQELQVLALLNLESKSKERGVHTGDKRLGASERGIMRSPSKNAGNACTTELLIHLRNISAHFQLLVFRFAERYRAISRTPLDSDKAV